MIKNILSILLLLFILDNSVVKSWDEKPMERCWYTCKQAKQDVFIDEEFEC